jgi:hypothetical protein
LNGQTWHESGHNVHDYDINWRHNLREIFGYQWLRTLFNPFATSRLGHDGTQFRKKNSNNNPNDNDGNISSPFSVPKRRVI